MSSVIDRLPENMRSMLDSEVAFGPTGPDNLIHSQTNVRLTYLQDLYRFFRLSDRRGNFFNPFGGEEGTNALFFNNPVFRSTPLARQVLPLGNFLLKSRANDDCRISLFLCHFENFLGKIIASGGSAIIHITNI